jgi:hypothetical protein
MVKPSRLARKKSIIEKNPLLKWGGAGLAALASVVVASVSGLLILGLWKLHARSAPLVSLNVAGTTEQIQRGQAISDGFCSDCHSTTGRHTGGLDIGGHFPLPIGSFVSSNLTPAGPLSRWADRTAMIMISSPQAGLFRSRSLPMGGEGWIWDFHREGVLLSLTTSSKAIECTGDP